MQAGTQKCLTDTGGLSKLELKNGRAVCPQCGRLLNVSVLPWTSADALPAWCRRCRWQGQLNINKGVCFIVSPNR